MPIESAMEKNKDNEKKDDPPVSRRQRSSKKETSQSSHKSSVSRPAKEHTFLTDVADVRAMEHGLLALLDNFHSGKLQAFGSRATFNKMDAIRIQQEQLAKQHFELDLLPRSSANRMTSEETRKECNDKMDKLIEQLHVLSTSVQSLHTNLGKQKSKCRSDDDSS